MIQIRLSAWGSGKHSCVTLSPVTWRKTRLSCFVFEIFEKHGNTMKSFLLFPAFSENVGKQHVILSTFHKNCLN